MKVYYSNSQEVLCVEDGERRHIADVCSADYASKIAEALNLQTEISKQISLISPFFNNQRPATFINRYLKKERKRFIRKSIKNSLQTQNNMIN